MFDRFKSRNYSSIAKKKIINNYTGQFLMKQTTKSIELNKPKIKIKPPFSPGFFSYNKSMINIQKKKNNHSRNIKINNNNFFLSNTYSLNPKNTKNFSNQQNSNLR